ncbi:mitotic fidelity of chromosome transmission- protein, partial [Dispira simplex]
SIQSVDTSQSCVRRSKRTHTPREDYFEMQFPDYIHQWSPRRSKAIETASSQSDDVSRTVPTDKSSPRNRSPARPASTTPGQLSNKRKRKRGISGATKEPVVEITTTPRKLGNSVDRTKANSPLPPESPSTGQPISTSPKQPRKGAPTPIKPLQSVTTRSVATATSPMANESGLFTDSPVLDYHLPTTPVSGSTTDCLEGIVRDHVTQGTRTMTLAWSGCSVRPALVLGKTFLFKECLRLDDWLHSGVVVIQIRGEKSINRAQDAALIFYVTYGKCQVQIEENVFYVEDGDQFIVPPDNHYRIVNVSHSSATLFYICAKIPMVSAASTEPSSPEGG